MRTRRNCAGCSFRKRALPGSVGFILTVAASSDSSKIRSRVDTLAKAQQACGEMMRMKPVVERTRCHALCGRLRPAHEHGTAGPERVEPRSLVIEGCGPFVCLAQALATASNPRMRVFSGIMM